MSPLPQRKKSPEEIARLRESLGVAPGALPHGLPAADSPSETLGSHIHKTDLAHDAGTATLEPMPGPKAVHSLRRSERLSAPPSSPVEPRSAPTPALEPEPPPKKLDPKPVRSLRKSEQIPLAPRPETDERGKIPYRRHSDEEMNEIRRREALALLNTAPPDPKLLPAHPALIAPGYVMAASGAACFIFEDYPLAATVGCVTAALLIAAAIVMRRPLSRHHAAFILIIALFVIVFGALHYFPQLRHAA